MMRVPLIHLLRSARFRRFLILAHDTIMVTSAFPIAIYLRENFAPAPQQISPAIYGTILLFVIVLIAFRAMGVQQTMWRYSSPQDFLHLAKSLCVVTAIFFPLMFLVDRLEGIPRSALVIFWFVAFASLCANRLSYVWAVQLYAKHALSKSGHPVCRVLVLANLQSSSAVIHTIKTVYGHEIDVVGIVGHDGERGRLQHGVEILGHAEHLAEILALLDVAGRYPHAIVFGDNDRRSPAWLNAHVTSVAPGIAIFKSSEVIDLATFIENRPDPTDIFKRQAEATRRFDIKRLIDFAVSFIALLLLIPILASIAGLLCILHGPPVIFAQVRAGKQLREFRLVKFRTMKPPLDASGRILQDHERVTRIGSFLRKTRLDELPQLWNVLCGDMSLIGPRPLLRRDMPNEVNILAERYSVRPGITGWAQVNGGHQVETIEKMYLDIFYIRNSSLAFDMKIIIMTLRMIIFGEKIDQAAIKNAKIVFATKEKLEYQQ